MKRWLVLLAALSFVGGACGKDDDALAQTQANMAKLKSGVMDLRLAASAGAGPDKTGPVGFQLEGPFALSSEHDLAVFDLTYTRLLGSDQKVTKVVSTGDAAFVTANSKTYKVDDADLGPLRVSDEAPGGLGDLGIKDWVRNPKVTPGDEVDGEATDTISGQVNAGELLSDLARVSAEIGGDTELDALDEDAAKRLQRLVEKSSIRVVTTADDRALRSLRAVVDFGSRAPAELRSKLGAYARARYEITLTIKKASRTLRVEAPSGYASR